MAEREGFEPPIALRLCLISSQVHSTGLCHLSETPSYQSQQSRKTITAKSTLRFQCYAVRPTGFLLNKNSSPAKAASDAIPASPSTRRTATV